MANKASSKTVKKNNNKLLVWVFVVLFILIVLSVTVIIVLNNKEIFGVDESSLVTNETQYVVEYDMQDRRGSSDEIDETSPIKVYNVYYHDGANITNFKTYNKFIDEESAKKAFALEEMQDYRDNGYSVVLSGQFIVLTADKSFYEGETLESVKYWTELYNEVKQDDTDGKVIEGADDVEPDVETEDIVNTTVLETAE